MVRNDTVDIIRGFAMLLVVLGHTMSGSTVEYQNSFIFQVIWTLQMPLFIIISGYVTRYSKPITTGGRLGKFMKKRSFAYLLPWAAWTYIVRGIILGQSIFFDIKYLLWHMDSGYWFLITIWTISMIYGISDYVANKLFKQIRINIIAHLFICGIGMISLILLGLIEGFDFFCIKLTLYYFPFFILGYLYGHLQDWFLARNNIRNLIDIFSIVFWAIWLFFIVRYNFFSDSDSREFVILRFLTSIVGCVAVISSFVGSKDHGVKVFRWAGVHSLEIYLTHYLFLNILNMEPLSGLMTISGMSMLVVNFSLTLILTFIVVKFIQKNNAMNYLLYGKSAK